ncbi:MAG: hypothetical protein ABIK86_03200 [candidate division WOR-3 bacterium]
MACSRAVVRPAHLRLLAVGALGFAAQVVLVRELMATFAGNELTVGVVVAVWILFESSGALVAARIPDTRAASLAFLFGLGSALASMAAVLSPVFARTVLGLIPAETFSLPQVVLVSASAAFLPAGLHGALFVLCAAGLGRDLDQPGTDQGRTGRDAPGTAYLLEGLGTSIAGLVVSFVLVSRVPALSIVAGAGVLLALALVAGERRPVPILSGAVTIGLCGLAAWSAPEVERRTATMAGPGQEVTAVVNSPYGKLVSLRRAEQRVVLYDGVPVMSVPPSDPAAIEELVGFGLLAHAQPRKVVMLGHALGGYVAEALKYPVDEVTVVELDPFLTRAAIIAGDSLVEQELADHRVRYVHADPIRFMATAPGKYDCIIQLAVQPMNLAGSRQFTVEFFRLCQERLADGGVFVVAAPGDAARLSPELADILRLRHRTMAAAFTSVQVLSADFPILFGAARQLNLTPETLARRLGQTGVQNRVLDQGYVLALLSDFRSRALALELNQNRGDVSSTVVPRELFLSMVWQNRLAGPGFGRWYARVGQLSAGWLALPLFLLLAVGLAGARLGNSRFRYGFAIVVSGLAGAAVVTMTAFGFQVRHGSAYSGVTMILAAFMLGSVLGAGLGRILGRSRTRPFVMAELLLALCCFVQPVLTRTGSALWFGFVALLAGGCLGLEFAIASAVRPGTVATRTGILTSLDLVGGFGGGLVTGLLLLPVYGVLGAGVLVGTAKLVSLLVQVVPSRSG